MLYARCIVDEGLHRTLSSVSIQDCFGRNVHVSVSKDCIKDGRLCPVTPIRWDNDSGQVLVELPNESDAGDKRIWVFQSGVVSGI